MRKRKSEPRTWRYADAVNLTEPDLLRLIAKGENSRLEFQSEVPDDETLARILCAFANTRGGTLLVGVDEDGHTLGCADPADAMSRIRLVAEEDIKPPLDLASASVRLEAGILVVVKVNHSMDRPHSIPCAKRKREIIVRVGTGNELADGGTLNALRSHRTQEQPKGPLESKILEWIAARERDAGDPLGSATPELFSKAANVGLRRASKAFINLECAGLLMGAGDRTHRFYALP